MQSIVYEQKSGKVTQTGTSIILYENYCIESFPPLNKLIVTVSGESVSKQKPIIKVFLGGTLNPLEKVYLQVADEVSSDDNGNFVGVYYIDEKIGCWNISIESDIALTGALYSILDVKWLNNGVVSTNTENEQLGTFQQTGDKIYNLVVGAASNSDTSGVLEHPPGGITQLNLLLSDKLDNDESGGGAAYKANTPRGMYTLKFQGDNINPLAVIATFETDVTMCMLTYKSSFNCNKREWSAPTLVNIDCTVEGLETDWQITECDAFKSLPCIQQYCGSMPPPSPPSASSAPCCRRCIWLFVKEYDCDKETWVCTDAIVDCLDGGGDGTWNIIGCKAYASLALEIPCGEGGGCPTPTCDQAPPGPFTKPNQECCDKSESCCAQDTSTQCEPCVGNCKFLGCSVVGFNGAIGWNTQESTVNIDLVEVQCDIDGTGAPPEVFTGANLIGYPVYFNCGSFFFGGLLQNWTYQQNSGGRTYNVKVIDPRQVLEQCVLIIDTYAGPPVRTLNYFNVYGFYEEEVYKNKNCDLFGTAESTERGMPYNKIMYALKNMNPVICTPVGANLTIDWSTFNIPVPEYFKIAGPSITILQLIADICDEAGYDFFVTLEPGDIVRIYPVSMKQYDPIEDNLLFGFNNVIDFTYGKELRMTKTRNLLFGEQQHYLDVVYFQTEEFSPEAEVQYVFNGVTGEKQYSIGQSSDNTDPFEFYFGEEVDPLTGEGKPIIPYKREFGQFWIDIDIRKLNLNLIIPFPVDRMNICEYDIRTAMSSFESFWSWTAHEETPSELGKAIQTNWDVTYSPKAVLERLNQSAVTLPYALADAAGLPNSDRAKFNRHSWPPIIEDIKKVHEWIAELGRTYYGRQYLVSLNEKVCVKDHPENFGEKLYTDTPTNDGGWVEPGIPVMGLQDPDLGLFRTDDDRVGSFALFCNPDNLSDILRYSGSGGGDYQYTLGSGILDISVPPSGSGV